MHSKSRFAVVGIVVALAFGGAVIVAAPAIAGETRVLGAKTCINGGVAMKARINDLSSVAVYQSNGNTYANTTGTIGTWRDWYSYSGIKYSTGQSGYAYGHFESLSAFCDS